MSNTNTGGPAFPTEVWDAEGIPQHTEGMTLRDYFAAHVDTHDVPMSVYEALIGQPPSYGTPMQMQDWWARAEAAYRYHRAAAMLKAREA